VRGRSRSLLLSAFFALCAGGGVGTAGWVWLDAAPASAQPLSAAASLDNFHGSGSATSAATGNGKGNGHAQGHGNGHGQGQGNRPGNRLSAAQPQVRLASQSAQSSQGNASSLGAGNGNSQGAAVLRSNGRSARAPGHNKTTSTPLMQSPQVAVPRQARPAAPRTVPAAAAPPSRAPAAIGALESIATRVGTAALDLSGAPSGGIRVSLPGTAFQAVIPAGRLPGAGFYRRELGLLNGSVPGTSVRVAGKLKLPLALMVGGALFMLIQSLVDRRDPKVTHAPEHPQDDSLDFL
jgi:hypothetical protein